jgi:small subunit ribosomal protein S9
MDDEQKTPEQDEIPQDEGAGPVGPAAAGDPPPPATSQEEVPPTTSPTGEAAEEEPSEEGGDEGPSEEVADDPVAEEVTSPEPDQEVEETEETPPAPEPKAEEKKKDVIPGADLEPILVEPDKPELSAEEKARLEAEEEEKARREAELAAAEETDAAASRAPAKIEKGARFLATGKRKSSIARVTLLPGNGKITINKRDLDEFFPRPLHQTMAKQPLVVSGYEGNVDVRVRVHGGGISGQAGAVRHGIARALTEIDAELRGDLKRRGFLTRDARVKERRKAGLKKARKRPQFSKR